MGREPLPVERPAVTVAAATFDADLVHFVLR